MLYIAQSLTSVGVKDADGSIHTVALTKDHSQEVQTVRKSECLQNGSF